MGVYGTDVYEKEQMDPTYYHMWMSTLRRVSDKLVVSTMKIKLMKEGYKLQGKKIQKDSMCQTLF